MKHFGTILDSNVEVESMVFPMYSFLKKEISPITQPLIIINEKIKIWKHKKKNVMRDLPNI
jgi:hypothetical protein